MLRGTGCKRNQEAAVCTGGVTASSLQHWCTLGSHHFHICYHWHVGVWARQAAGRTGRHGQLWDVRTQHATLVQVCAIRPVYFCSKLNYVVVEPMSLLKFRIQDNLQPVPSISRHHSLFARIHFNVIHHLIFNLRYCCFRSEFPKNRCMLFKLTVTILYTSLSYQH